MRTHKELTPYRAVLLYTVVMTLVISSKFPQVSSWAQETWWNLTSGATARAIADNIHERVSDHVETTEKSQKVKFTQAGITKSVRAQVPKVTEITVHTQSDLNFESDIPFDTAAGKGTSYYEFVPWMNQLWPLSLQSPPLCTDAANSGGKSLTKNDFLYDIKLKPHKVLIVGDSEIAEGFGPILQRKLEKFNSIHVLRKGVYSTGFVHQETFNWSDNIRSLINNDHPDLIIIHIGANDDIDVAPKSGRRLYFGNDKWTAVYSSRVAKFLKTVSEKKIMTFWVGLPIMGSPKYSAKIEIINSIFKQECSKISGCFYVNTWPALTDLNGKYTSYLRDPGGKLTRIRAKDNVHLTEAGGEILTKYFIKVASRHVELSNADKVSSSR